MKWLFLPLGLLCFACGTVGVFLPILPTTPFYLLAAFFFARSSPRLHAWFLSTALYRNHLDSFVRSRALPLRTKVGVMLTVTLALLLCAIVMDGLLAGQLIVLVIWVWHLWYFTQRIKTLPLHKD